MSDGYAMVTEGLKQYLLINLLLYNKIGRIDFFLFVLTLCCLFYCDYCNGCLDKFEFHASFFNSMKLYIPRIIYTGTTIYNVKSAYPFILEKQ